ncbi:gliding motility-associated C-terminal domain-containing protein [Mucilaginibacter sp. SP1R1]|uniref:T9SS type B sorting domain-containing protein n=1 Tax=Mucilaginibacter sp. SP1R1 TaxID=2723091 RepID=UPI00161673DF|nr:gliding motility-associated C-terminal domain-containing protein [Mucilaginibacter sp. SP1R1]MBB6148381.1 gliding motility-associated-like protein [Mucilaginibacter sp. SP1R1]
MKRLLYVVAVIRFFFSFLSQASAQSNQIVTNGDVTTPANFPGAACSYTWVNSNPSIGLPANGTGNIQGFTAINSGDVPVTATITATPAATGFAYIFSSIGQLSAIDLSTNQIVSTTETSFRAFGEAISPDGKFVYITDPSDNAVITLNASTYAIEGYTSTGNNSSPRGITISPDGSKIYVTNEYPFDVIGHGTVDIINTVTHNITATINVGESPLGIVMSSDGSKIYVANQGSSFISVINANTGAAIGQIPLNHGASSLAVTLDGSQLYVTAGASVSVINTATNQVVKTIDVGLNPISMAISPDNKKVYVVNEDSRSVSVIDNQTKTVIATIDLPGGQSPFSISLSPDGTKAYAINQNGVISVINTANNSVINSITTVTGALSYGNFVSAGPGCSSSPVTFTITVKPTVAAPLIKAGPASGAISACIGSPSVSPYIQQFTAICSNLTAPVIITASNGFEISLIAGNGYSNSLSLVPSGGILNQIIYVRSNAADAIGDISGNVILSSAGAVNQRVTVSGTINALPMINTVPNQIKNNGTQSDLVTFTGTGNTYIWVNDHPEIGLAASGTGNIATFSTVNNTASPIVAKITATPSNSPYAYITNSASASVSVINAATNKIVATIPMGADPQDITVSHDGKKIYVSDPISRTISVINTVTNTVIATIPVPVGSFSMVVSPDNSKLYLVAINPDLGNDDIYIINTTTYNITSTLRVGVSIGIIALSPDGSTLYATDNVQNKLLVISASDGQLLKTIIVGTAPEGVMVSKDGGTAYVCNSGSNTVSVINTITNIVSKTVTVGTAPFALALSPDGNILYVSGYGDGTVAAINTSSNTVLFKADAGQYPMGISVTPNGASVYVANSNSGTVTVIDALSGVKQETIPVGLNPFSIGSFITPVSGCPGQPVTFTITVEPTITSAVIKISGNVDPLATVYGTPSLASGFTISATNLTSGIVITPPSGFEISTSGTTFSQTVTVGTIGTLIPTKIYIRLSATTAVGNYTGDILLSTDNTPDQVISTASNNTVSPASLIITADNERKYYGDDNPVLTLTYSGFVNMETALVLTPQPLVTTDATSTSPAGQYLITVHGAGSINYAITYVSGSLTIAPIKEALIIPNTFTPNGDGINDRWEIKHIEDYPNCTVNIYNRYGEKILTSHGYGISWDGKYKGKDVSTGTYYYVIDIKPGSKPLSGWIAIIR